MNKRNENTTPRENTYTEVYLYLKARILSGEFPTWGPLPSVDSLITYHGFTRACIQKALAALEAEGLVLRRTGAGVYVQPPKSLELNEKQNEAVENFFQAIKLCREAGLSRREIEFVIDHTYRFQRKH